MPALYPTRSYLMGFFVRHLCYPGDSDRCWWPNLWEQRKSSVQYSPRTTIFLCGFSDRYVISSGNEAVWKPKGKVSSRKKRQCIMTVARETYFYGLEPRESSTVWGLKQGCGNELQKKDVFCAVIYSSEWPYSAAQELGGFGAVNILVGFYHCNNVFSRSSW